MPFTRRGALRTGAAAGAAVILSGGARAQQQAGDAAFPSRPVRVIVPFGAGGVADLTARTVGQRLSERLGQPVVVENRPGAGGIAAAQATLGAAADGHTLMLASNGTAISRALFRSLPFEPLRDFAPVVTLGAFAIAILVAPDSPIRRPQDLVARMKREPGRVNIGTISVGSTQNLSAELFGIRAGAEAVMVPFPQTPALVTALLRGDVDAAFEITGPIWGQIESGQLRPVAVTSARRPPNLPEVPTLREAVPGMEDFDVASWNALVAPAGTPAAAIELLNREANAALAEPELRQKLLAVGVEARGGTPEELRELLATEVARWTEVIEKAGIPRQ